jgi:hypothetical protein
VRSNPTLIWALLVASGLYTSGCRTTKQDNATDALKDCQLSWEGPVRKFSCGSFDGSDQFMPGEGGSLDDVLDGTTRGMNELSKSKATWKSVDLDLPEASARAYRFSWADSPEGWFHDWYFVIAGGGSKGIRSLTCGTRIGTDLSQTLARCAGIIRHLISKPLPDAPRVTELNVFGTKLTARKDCAVEAGKLMCPEAILEVLEKAPAGEPDEVLDVSVAGISKGYGGLTRNEAYSCTAFGVQAKCRELSFVEKDGTHSATVIAYPISAENPSRLSCFFRDGPVPALCGIQRSAAK